MQFQLKGLEQRPSSLQCFGLIFTPPQSWQISSQARLTQLAVHHMALPEAQFYKCKYFNEKNSEESQQTFFMRFTNGSHLIVPLSLQRIS